VKESVDSDVTGCGVLFIVDDQVRDKGTTYIGVSV
jgi:hypothetical protein